MPRALALLLVLAVACLPALARAGDAHDNLCSSLTRGSVSGAALERALEQGASPDAPCPITKRDMRLRWEGLALLLATGGAAAVVPGWLGPRAWEEHTQVVPVPPLALASQRRSERGVDLLLEAGADPVGLEGEFAGAVGRGELAWAELLAGTPADRRVGELPRALLTPAQLGRLLALEPGLADAEIDWHEAAARFEVHPEMLDLLLAGGLPHRSTHGAFQKAVDQDRMAFGAALARTGADRRLWSIPASVLGDRDRLEQLVALRPDLEPLILLGSVILDAADRNPALLHQLEAAGLDPIELATPALRYGELEVVEKLVELGMDPSAQPRAPHALPLLTEAVTRGDDEATELLLDLGARVGPDGHHNAARRAARAGEVGLAIAVVERGADPALQPALWRAIVDEGIERRHPEMIEAALAPGRGRGMPGLEELAVRVIDQYRPELLPPLVAGSEDPVGVATAALGRAAEYGRPDDLRLALELGADPNRGTAPDGDSALHRGVGGWRHHQAETVAILVEGGADLQARDRQGLTPLGRALEERCWGAVEPLLAAGARPELALVEQALEQDRLDRDRAAAVTAIIRSEPEARPRDWKRLWRSAKRKRMDPKLVEALESAWR